MRWGNSNNNYCKMYGAGCYKRTISSLYIYLYSEHWKWLYVFYIKIIYFLILYMPSRYIYTWWFYTIYNIMYTVCEIPILTIERRKWKQYTYIPFFGNNWNYYSLWHQKSWLCPVIDMQKGFSINVLQCCIIYSAQT